MASIEVLDDSRRRRWAREIWLWLMTGKRSGRLYLPPYPLLLEQRHLESCQMVCQRGELISRLSVPANAKVAEIGVFRGEFSRVLLDRLQPSELHLFDLNLRQHRIAERFAEEVAVKRVYLHEGDSSTRISALPLDYFDVIYVDGDHSYAGVVKDIDASAPRLAAGGYLVFNDYTFWSPCENLEYGIMQAVNEFCRREDWQVTHFALDGYMYCDIALRRRLPS